jgi:VWFA-related protein
MMPMGILRSLAIIPLAAVLATAQEEPTFRTGVNVVVAPTVVTDSDGNIVHGLQPSDFRLTDNDKLQQISVSTEYTPISLVIAIQANRSSEGALDRIKKIGPTLQSLVTGEHGEIAIMAYDHRVQLLQDFTSDSDKLEAALGQLKAGSSSAVMNDAVVTASRMLSKRPPDRRRILLLIGETRDVASAAKPKQALTDLQFANVLVYSVNMSRFVNTLSAKPEAPRPDPFPPGARASAPHSPNLPAYSSQVYGNASNSANFIPMLVEIFKATKSIFVDNPIEVYTKWTGGKEHAFVTQRDLERAISAIGTELHSQYVITYAPSNRDEGGFHDIEVSILKPPGLKVRTRPGYWVAAQPNP